MHRYSQAGTPLVKVNSSYNPEAHTFSLKFRYTSFMFSLLFLDWVVYRNLGFDYIFQWFVFDNVFLWGPFCSQEIRPTPGQPVKEPMFIPVVVGLLDSTGKDIPLSTIYHDGTLRFVSSNDKPAYTTVLRVTKVV